MEGEGKLLQEASSHHHCPPHGPFSFARVSMKLYFVSLPMLGSEKSLRPIHFYERVCVNNLRFSPLIRSSNSSHLVLDLYNLVFVVEYKKKNKKKKRIEVC